MLAVFQTEGLFKEGVTAQNGVVLVSYTKFFTRYISHVYTDDYLVKGSTTSLGALKGLCTLVLTTGDRRKLKARSIDWATATALFGLPCPSAPGR